MRTLNLENVYLRRRSVQCNPATRHGTNPYSFIYLVISSMWFLSHDEDVMRLPCHISCNFRLLPSDDHAFHCSTSRSNASIKDNLLVAQNHFQFSRHAC